LRHPSTATPTERTSSLQRQQPVYRNLKSLGEAQSIFTSRFRGIFAGPEVIAVRQALGRILTQPVRATRSVPAYHASAMDGVAVRAAATFGALQESPVVLQAAEDTVRVNTGDPLPESADAVVMIEKVESEGDRFVISEAVYPWQNVRKTGEDIVAGEIILPARHKIRPHDQGLLLAAGILAVEVFARPKVLIIPTGDEIISPEEAPDPLPPGAILEVNGQILESMIVECGATPVLHEAVPDDPVKIKDAIQEGLDAGYPVILIIAGSSAGTEDFTPRLLEEMGELLVHGITVMPGKPTLLAAVQDRPVIGVPGYPVSAVIAFREFVKPLLHQMQGERPTEPETVEALLGRKLPSKPGLEEHVRVILGNVGGKIVTLPLAAGAGMMSSLVRADGILRVPADLTGHSEGDMVRVELLIPARSLDHRLIAIGSHDMTIDLLASQLLEESGGLITISSSNVGSLGGLLALGKGIAHLAGSHLLDTQTGEYNHSYIRRYLPNTPVTLITLVHRWQGLMIRKGNPKGIREFSDLARPGVTFVNRQPGSGTRILLDYELERAGIGTAGILGYRNEEYTHMNTAMAVASGRADVGLGIMAAAHALGLEFVRCIRERYDLVIPSPFLDDERIRSLIAVIQSPRFRAQVASLGGYETEETGRILESPD
jgi:molybdenum cofactor synthesis domain-containing protein